MEITINFSDGPLNVEIQATEEEDFNAVLDNLSEFVENYSPRFDRDPVDSDGEGTNGNDSPDKFRDLSDIPVDQLARVVKRGRVEDGEITELPRIIANTEELGGSSQEKLLHGATIILGLFDEFQGINKIRTTELKQALADSGLNADNWGNISQLETEEVYLTRRGSGSSGTTELRPPGKDKAIELMNSLIS